MTEILLIALGLTMVVYGIIRRCPSITFVVFLNIPIVKWVFGVCAGTLLALLLGMGVNPATAGLFHQAAIIAEIGLCELAVHIALNQRKIEIQKWISDTKIKTDKSKPWEYLPDKFLIKYNGGSNARS